MLIRILSLRLCFSLICFSFVCFDLNAQQPLSVFINTSEGGEISKRRLNKLKNYLNENACQVTDIDTGMAYPESLNADLVFAPLAHQFSKRYQPLAKIKVINNAPLSTSILVRGSTGITDIKALAGVRIAYLSEHSVTGYHLAQALFEKAGIKHQRDRITYTQTNVGAMVLLLHKDVFAAAVATPLAKKWADANDLNIVAMSEVVEPGGLWVTNKLALEKINNCKAAFVSLTNQTREGKKILKVLPAWIDRFDDR